jgi:hypothetical protein
MEITKREVIASIVIIAFMLIIGFGISGKISDYQNDKNAEYQKAIQITESDMFEYGMKTNVGNAFVYGDLQAVDTVNFDEIGGEYLYVYKEEQHYNRHEKTVIDYDEKGNVKGSHTEVYYSWDYYDSWKTHSEKITFCGIEFPYGTIKTPSSHYITTIKKSSSVRYEYYGVAAKHTGTIYTKLYNGTISNESKFYEDKNIEETLDAFTSSAGTIIFWIFWIAAIGGVVYGFYYLDNYWLED